MSSNIHRKPLDLLQYTLFIVSFGLLLFVSWKWAMLVFILDGVIGIARMEQA